MDIRFYFVCGIFEDGLEQPVIYMSYPLAARKLSKGESINLLLRLGKMCIRDRFYVVFTLLRTYAGGVHAKTETACTIFTTFAIVVSVLLIRLLEIFAAGTVSFLILGIGSLCILAFSPLDTAEKPLKEQDKKRYRLATLITLMLCITTTLVARLWMLAGVFYSIVCGISLEGLLLALGMLQKCRKLSLIHIFPAP